ncbi:HAD family hydrolase [Streptomyces sp. UC4497]
MTTPPASPDTLQAVLFDSGGVLMQPIGGRWNPRADFEQTVLAHAPSITPEQFAAAISAGDHFFAASSSTPDYDDYHRLMLHHLGVEPTSRLLADLGREVPPVRVRMAVVSDAWPGLPDLHAGLGIDRYFEAYAISAVLGCNKSDPRMYHHATAARDTPADPDVPSIASLTELLQLCR